MCTTIEELQQVPFASRTLVNKVQVVSGGKPRPCLDIKDFNTAVYDEIQWLTGCEKKQSLFCWPCMLFVTDELWNQFEISDLVFMKECVVEHEKKCEHIQAALDLEMFNMQHLIHKKAQTDGVDHCDIIRKNRQIVKTLINVLCAVVAKDQPPHQKTDRPRRVTPENCVKVAELLHKYGSDTKDAIELIEKSPTVLNELVDSISKVMRLEVKKETQSSTYAVIIMSEHSTDVKKPQISTVLRYIKNSKVCERFIGFTPFKKKSPVVILNHITSLIEEFGLSESFLAFSFDGGVLHQSALKQVVEVLKDIYPCSFFVPSYFHTLHYIFQQSLSEYKECATFFKTLKIMEIYFQKNSKQWTVFSNKPQLRNSKWSSKSEFITVVNSYRKYFVEFFDCVVKNSNKWTAEDIAIARGLHLYLRELETAFLLQLYSKLMDLTEVFDELLKTPSPDKIFGGQIMQNILRNLEKEQEQGFEKLWNSVIEEIVNYDAEKSKRLKVDYSAKAEFCRTLFNSVIDHIIKEMKFRFSAVYLLEFSCMVEDHIKENTELKALPSDFDLYLTKLMEVQRPFFHEEQLRNEFIVLRKNGSIFSKKSVHDLLKFFTEAHLVSTFKYLNKLVEFILTMPFKLPSSNDDVSKFKKISNFAYTTSDSSSTGDISLLHIEFDLLQDAMKKIYFYEEVMNRFCEVNKSVELKFGTEARVIL